MITRVVYVDILKGFSMMAVVLFHIDCQFPKASWFCPYMFGDMWHVPLFFLLSGFFIKDEKLSDIKDFLKSKLKVLYVKGLYYFIPVVLLHNYFIYWGWYKMDYSYSGEFVKILEMGDFWWLILKNFLLMSREPIVGAMWFVDSLLIAMVGLCLLKWVTTFLKVNKDFWFCIMVLILVVMSNVLTREYGVVIPKISNSITAMGLILFGKFFYQHGYASYVNKYSFLVSLLLLWQFSVLDGKVGLNNNRYTSIIQLIGITLSAYFSLAYLAKKIESKMVGRVCAYIGESSFSIMGLHFIGFKVCSIILSIITGCEFGTYYLTTPKLGHDYLYVLIYFLFGIAIPLLVLKIIRGVYVMCKKTIISNIN